MNIIRKSSITIQGLKIVYYTVNGQGNPIIFLHGGGVDSAMLSWKEILECWQSNNRLIAIDLPGYGQSDKPDSIEYSTKFYGTIVNEFIEQLGLTNICLCGLSMGGGITLYMALHYPQLLSKIVLVAPWGIIKQLPYQRFTAYMVRSTWYKKLTFLYKSHWITQKTLEQTLFGDKKKISTELVDTISRLSTAPKAMIPFASFQRSEIHPTYITSNFTSRLHEIRMPVLFVSGEKDPGVPIKAVIEAAKLLSDARIEIFEKHKHWPQKENPERFVKVVNKFIN